MIFLASHQSKEEYPFLLVVSHIRHIFEPALVNHIPRSTEKIVLKNVIDEIVLRFCPDVEDGGGH